MKPELNEIMAGLESIRERADQAFAQIAQAHPQEVACKPGCDDCCHALFDLSPLEAYALAEAFQALPRAQRRETLRRAQKAAAEFDRAVKEALAQPPEKHLAGLSRARVACPLLSKGRCLLYGSRPITCRLYGVPVASQGEARTCHKARFRQGGTYTTADLDAVNRELDGLSAQLQELTPDAPRERLDVARALQTLRTDPAKP